MSSDAACGMQDQSLLVLKFDTETKVMSASSPEY